MKGSLKRLVGRHIKNNYPATLMATREVPIVRTLLRTGTKLGSWWFSRGDMVPHTFGYSAYKRSQIEAAISSDEVAQQLRAGELDRGYGRNLDERIIEYPWAFSMIPQNSREILDAGSTLNYDYLLTSSPLKSRNITIFTLDREAYVHTSEPVSYVYGDLRLTPFRDQQFDLVLCLSTLEHVGLDNSLYTSDPRRIEHNSEDYLKVIDELIRVTKPGGRVLISMPYGKARNWGWFQVFDRRKIERIRERSMPHHFTETYFKYRDQQWQFSTQNECEDSQCNVPVTGHQWNQGDPAFSEAIVCICIDL